MAEPPEDLYARVVAEVGTTGHLPMTPAAGWDVFPFEVAGGQLVPKVLAAPLPQEPPRAGEEGGEACDTCAGVRDDRRIWENDGWVLRTMPRGGLPLVLMLETKEHLDLTDLDDDQASELGRLSLWITRITEGLDHVGRVHVMRIGDGSSHLHVWHVARPARFAGILGSFAIEWDDMLPPTPEEDWLADQRTVATRLALHDGRSLVV
jgi:hypothetical protein